MELGTKTEAQLGRRRYRYESSSKPHGVLDGASNEIAPRTGCESKRILSKLTLNRVAHFRYRVDSVGLHSSAVSKKKNPQDDASLVSTPRLVSLKGRM